MAIKRVTSDSDKPRRPPAKTAEGRENQLIMLAYDLAEKQLRDGTASSQVITTILKAGTVRDQLEKEKLRVSNELDRARIENLSKGEESNEIALAAINAMRSYQGAGASEVTENDY